LRFSRFLSVPLLVFTAAVSSPATAQERHNIIIFVADGLRRGSVTAEDMPTFLKVRSTGVDFSNSHAVFPTFTTANASVIATGHGLGDTGDYSNSIYPGTWLSKPEIAPSAGTITPFLEDDELLADMNSIFSGNYLGERTLLSVAREKGFNVASVGKLGPTAIQQVESVNWLQPMSPTMFLSGSGATIVDDSTGKANGLLLPEDIMAALEAAKLPPEAPLRSNGYGDNSEWNNGFAGDAQTGGTLDANRIQEQWFADVTTKVLLPKFASDKKPFILLFWSRDPDGTQHNQGDSLQTLKPGINGDTSKRGLQNADHCLKQLLDWLDANPAIKSNTDVVITSDHGFATISRREIANDGGQTGEPSAALPYELNGKEKQQLPGTLPTGFLAVDLAIREHLRVYDPAVRATSGSSVYSEVLIGGEKSEHSSTGSALLGDSVKRMDGLDARLIVVANGGSDLIYVPDKSIDRVRETVRVLAQLDYVGGIFVDDRFCPALSDCPGALPLSAIGLVGHSQVPRPAIVVTYKVFYQTASDLQSAAMISDTTLQEGQGQHGGFGREQTLNNMAATGPDFKASFVDESPTGNMDIVPTLARILGIAMPSVGSLRGRIMLEALAKGEQANTQERKAMLSAPTPDGTKTLLEYQEMSGEMYYDSACLVVKNSAERCR
jgi:arylsulfatase A-like enzyme